ncbi:MAG: hypothetical protein NTW87_31330 [Planctomycetota bacterium]|nr:hypothetical protein [Planctomycetota bacterium]
MSQPRDAAAVQAQAQETGYMPRPQAETPRAVPWRAWAWMAAGFFGVLILAFCLARPKGKSAETPPPTPGQPALLHKRDGTSEEVRWIGFKAGGPDSSKWQHVIERRRPDGTWARVTVPHGELIQSDDTLEFLPVPGGAQKKQ